MTFKEKKELPADIKNQLKEANRAYTECISRDFLSRFLAGEKVNVEEFCVKEKTHMKSLD